MARRVERHDAVTTREQRIAQVDEARAATSPAVHEEHAGPALAPGPCGDPSRPHDHVNAPRFTQPRGHALADGAARRRAKKSRSAQRAASRGEARCTAPNAKRVSRRAVLMDAP